jgi:hypothetical protein
LTTYPIVTTTSDEKHQETVLTFGDLRFARMNPIAKDVDGDIAVATVLDAQRRLIR